MTAPDRERIINTLVGSLRDIESVLAVWEGGSTAMARSDHHSDIDLYIMVERGGIDEVMERVESSLGEMAGIEISYEPHGTHWPGVKQMFYRLSGVSPLLLIDMAVVENGAPESFLEVEKHGRARFLLSRIGEELPHVDPLVLLEMVTDRLSNIRKRYELFSPFLRKEMEREHLIDAIDTYNRVHLTTLVQLLRIRYCPARCDFGTLRICQDIPDEECERLEPLFLVGGMDDLDRNSMIVESWIRDLLEEMDTMGLESLISMSIVTHR